MAHVSGLELRVVHRSRIGTTIAWCVDTLTPEQRSVRQFCYRLAGTVPWVLARVVQPPNHPMLASVMAPGNQDVTMVPHVVTGPIKDDTTYEVLATFGREPSQVQATILVQPAGQHGGYARPGRVEMGGKTMTAPPVYIAGIAPEAARELAKAIKEQGLEVVSPSEPAK